MWWVKRHFPVMRESRVWSYENMKIIMWTAESRIKWRMIIAVTYATFAVAKRKPEKNFRLSCILIENTLFCRHSLNLTEDNFYKACTWIKVYYYYLSFLFYFCFKNNSIIKYINIIRHTQFFNMLWLEGQISSNYLAWISASPPPLAIVIY